jgi:hypothetical protein
VYEHRGPKFVGDRIAPLNLGFSGPSRWGPESVTRRYPRGRRVTIYVNPREPGSAVLEPGRQVFESVFLVLIGLGCFAFAVHLIRT